MVPSARQSNMRPTSRRVLAAITTWPGAAAACRRAAKVRGLARYVDTLWRLASPDLLADDNEPRGDADAGLQPDAGARVEALTAATAASPALTACSASSSCARG